MKCKRINVDLGNTKYEVALLLTNEEIHALFDHVGGTSHNNRVDYWGISSYHAKALGRLYNTLIKSLYSGTSDWISEKVFKEAK